MPRARKAATVPLRRDGSAKSIGTSSAVEMCGQFPQQAWSLVYAAPELREVRAVRARAWPAMEESEAKERIRHSPPVRGRAEGAYNARSTHRPLTASEEGTGS
jgi:hypothetical protein